MIEVMRLAEVGLLVVLLSTACGHRPVANTFFVDCEKGDQSRHIIGPVSISQDGRWRAYVDIDKGEDKQCFLTASLYIARRGGGYRTAYLMPPNVFAEGNGIRILGWAPHSTLFLIETEQWQWGSDADDGQNVLAIDARDGLVYKPNLDEILNSHRGQQCQSRVIAAGFGTGPNLSILVRARLATSVDAGDELSDVASSKRCFEGEETWSFTPGEIKRVANTEPMKLFNPQPLNF